MYYDGQINFSPKIESFETFWNFQIFKVDKSDWKQCLAERIIVLWKFQSTLTWQNWSNKKSFWHPILLDTKVFIQISKNSNNKAMYMQSAAYFGIIIMKSCWRLLAKLF